MRLHWSPPPEPNGVITSYIIFYNLDSDMPDASWTNLTKNGTFRDEEEGEREERERNRGFQIRIVYGVDMGSNSIPPKLFRMRV